MLKLEDENKTRIYADEKSNQSTEYNIFGQWYMARTHTHAHNNKKQYH